MSCTQLVYCYDTEDEALRTALHGHLASLQNEGLLESWNPCLIQFGDNIQAEIESRFSSANLVVCLVSSAFMASDFCQALTLTALRRQKDNQLRVVPVITRPVDWQSSAFASLAVLPYKGKPVTLWANSDEAWLDVARGIRRILGELAPGTQQDPGEEVSSYLSALWTSFENGTQILDHKLSEDPTDFIFPPMRYYSPDALPRVIEPAEKQLFLSEVMRTHQRTLFIGPPGAGKSSLLRQIARMAWTAPGALGLPGRRLPLLLPARRLVNGEGPLETRLVRALEAELPLISELPPRMFTQWPERTALPWLLLVDALDELSPRERAHAIQALSALSQLAAGYSVVVTSRPGDPAVRHFAQGGWQVLELLPFTPEQAGQFARQIFADDAGHFLEQLSEFSLGPLANTPLLLKMAAKVYEEQHTLPERRALLYESLVDIWLREAEGRISRRFAGSKLDGSRGLQLLRLCHLARCLTEEPEASGPRDLALKLAPYLQDEAALNRIQAAAGANDFVEAMAKESGIFGRYGSRCDFVHPSIREYLTACSILSQSDSDAKMLWDSVIHRWQEEAWTEVVLFAFELIRPETLTSRLLLDIAATGEAGLLFAVEVVCTGANNDRGTIEQLAFQLAKSVQRMTALDLQTRASPLVALHRLRDRADITSIICDLLRDTNVNQSIGITTIRLAESVRGTDFLKRIAEDSAIPSPLRGAASNALHNLGLPNSMPLVSVLVDVSGKVHFPSSPGEASGRVTSSPPTKSIGELLKLVRSSTIDRSKRERALSELAGVQRSLPHLLGLVRDSALDADFRQRALLELAGTQRSARHMLALVHDSTIDAELRLQAAELLEQYREGSDRARAWRDLASAMDLPPEIHYQAAESLIRLGDDAEARTVLLSLLKSTSTPPYHRGRAAARLCELGVAPAVLSLAETMANEPQATPALRYSLSETVRRFGRREVADRILASLLHCADPDPALLGLAADKLSGANNKESAAALWRKATNSLKASPRQRAEAAVALYGLGFANDAVRIWSELIFQPNTDEVLRREAAHAVARAGHPYAALNCWLILARDESVWLASRQEAIREIRVLQPYLSVAPALLDLVHCELLAQEVRLEAAICLAELGNGKEVAALFEQELKTSREREEDLDTVTGRFQLACAVALSSTGKQEEAERIAWNLAIYGRYHTVRISAILLLSRWGNPRRDQLKKLLLNVSNYYWEDLLPGLRKINQTGAATEVLLSLANDRDVCDGARAGFDLSGISLGKRLWDLGSKTAAFTVLSSVFSGPGEDVNARVQAGVDLYHYGGHVPDGALLAIMARSPIVDAVTALRAAEATVALGMGHLAVPLLEGIIQQIHQNSHGEVEYKAVLLLKKITP